LGFVFKNKLVQFIALTLRGSPVNIKRRTTVNRLYNGIIRGKGTDCPLSPMSAITEGRRVHGSTPQDTQPIHTINIDTYNVIT
jgi:hypothetical protein